jgi:hypothetical protein
VSPHLLQAGILALTGAGLWWTGAEDLRLQRRGYALALAAQPLWIFDTWQHGQWGMLALSCWLGISFARGLWVRRT